MDASHVYVRAWALGRFHSNIITGTFRGALTASLDSCADIKSCPFSVVTKYGRVWRKVPESDAGSVVWLLHGWCRMKLLPSRRTLTVHSIYHALVTVAHTLFEAKYVDACVFSCNLAPDLLAE